MKKLSSYCLLILFLMSLNSFAKKADYKMQINGIIQECLSKNKSRHIGQPLIDCRKKIMPVKRKMKNEDFYWEAAEVIRREIGDVESIQFYEKSLSIKKSESRCVEPTLSVAAYRTLGYSRDKFPEEVKAASNIVFELCWKELREEVLAETEVGKSSSWMETVCPVLKQRSVKIKNCK